jgi:Ca2+-binding RTX toxin-like protein
MGGGQGADVLTGGDAEDVFAFAFAFAGAGVLASIDTITDMLVNHDEFRLSRKAQIGIGPAGAGLAGDRFVLGAAATTGALSYVADGDGTGAAVQFAQIATGQALTSADFLVIA